MMVDITWICALPRKLRGGDWSSQTWLHCI